MDKKILVAKAIFPHAKLSLGSEVKLSKQGEIIICKVADICPLEGNKFIVWLQTSVEKIRLFWLMGTFYFNDPDGPEVSII